jgi:mannose-6-phosphate isomerase-like protein (cupin superfamily)
MEAPHRADDKPAFHLEPEECLMSIPDRSFTEYPPATYHGESGEASALIRRADAEPEIRYRTGGTASYLATSITTNNQFGLYRWDFGDRVSGPGPHFHRTISESFFVLSGAVELYDGHDWVRATRGDFMFVPEGGIHGFRNELTDERASMLLLFAPGAPREGYFETLKRLGEGLTMTDAERDAFYTAHDNVWL